MDPCWFPHPIGNPTDASSHNYFSSEIHRQQISLSHSSQSNLTPNFHSHSDASVFTNASASGIPPPLPGVATLSPFQGGGGGAVVGISQGKGAVAANSGIEDAMRSIDGDHDLGPDDEEGTVSNLRFRA